MEAIVFAVIIYVIWDAIKYADQVDREDKKNNKQK